MSCLRDLFDHVDRARQLRVEVTAKRIDHLTIVYSNTIILAKV